MEEQMRKQCEKFEERGGQDRIRKCWSRHLHQITASCPSAPPAYFATMRCAIAYLALVLHTFLDVLCILGRDEVYNVHTLLE